ncbi:hypothetical protein HLB25_21225 [Dickeya dadantii]|uniref:hypothetical protein n=1 Tax=Dickeya dadantii TaxID=204038 RepID=UPI001495DBDE|nr:hypothetical protein [Dickeya dadantii]NPE56589.1 hypothetical protein [Dickeya dadantii]NPE69035.1 hypothetical protein [Dickeya dadantii]
MAKIFLIYESEGLIFEECSFDKLKGTKKMTIKNICRLINEYDKTSHNICEVLGFSAAAFSKYKLIAKLPDEIIDRLTSLTTDVEIYYLYSRLFSKNRSLADKVLASAEQSGRLRRCDVRNKSIIPIFR